MDEEELEEIFGESIEAPLLQPSDESEGVEAAEEDLRGAAHKLLPDPGEPTAAEVEDHRACGHLPYRSWCHECVESRGTGEQHRKRTEARIVCVFAFDYLFLGHDGRAIRREELTEGREEVKVKLLVAKDIRGKAVFAHVIPQKGVDQDHYSVDAPVKDVQRLGYREVFLKSDNERAILKLLEHALTEIRMHARPVQQRRR